MHNQNNGYLEALVPRGLLIGARNILNSPVTQEGLSYIRLEWEKGYVTSLESISPAKSPPKQILLPRLIEPHTHIDKAFTWDISPNLKGTYLGALNANLKEHSLRTSDGVHQKAKRCLNLALTNGIRAMRTHIDIFGQEGSESWNVILDLKREWKGIIDLQCVALAPVEFWATKEGEIFASSFASSNSLIGGVIVPPFNNRTMHDALFNLLSLADKVGCNIDLHIDESKDNPGTGLKQLIKVLDQIKVDIKITCSHLSSLGLMPSEKIKNLADQIAEHDLKVIALPLTNGWLLGRGAGKTATQKPLAPIKQLQSAGVSVSIGGDNIQDPWFPSGNLDPIALMSYALPLTQLAPWNRLGLSTFTTAASNTLGLKWDGCIATGCPADLVVCDATSWVDLLSKPPKRNVLLKGRWLEKAKLK